MESREIEYKEKSKTRTGILHLFMKVLKKDGEKVLGIVEDLETGELKEVEISKIRFTSPPRGYYVDDGEPF